MVNPGAFLEPVYLNEKMVLNCAAYVFKGYSLESEANATTQTEHSRAGKAGFGFLQKLITFGMEAGSRQSTTVGDRSARRYTVGGLHMSLIDQLHGLGLLHAVAPDSLKEDVGSGGGYVEMLAELRPIDFYALIDTLRIAVPIVEKALTSIVRPLYDQHRESQWRARQQLEESQSPDTARGRKEGTRRGQTKRDRSEREGLDRVQLALGETEHYATAVQGLLEHLEGDYRRSKQVEMVMWSVGDEPRPYGVVDLDLAGQQPEELRAKLAGGRYHVVGKVTHEVGTGQSINLLQKSVLFSVVSVLNRVMEAQGEADALRQYRKGLSDVKAVLEQFGLFEVRGPALRVSAMSICI